MDKTKEQRIASRERFIAQRNKAIDMLRSASLYDFINGLKYTYSLCMRYKKNLRVLVEYASTTGVESIYPAYTNVQKCLKAGILKPWNDTYWFDKEKAQSLQEYILEHNQ